MLQTSLTFAAKLMSRQTSANQTKGCHKLCKGSHDFRRVYVLQMAQAQGAQHHKL
jgi:hypothetical protein